MSYDVHTPTPTRPKRRIARFVMPVASAAFICGAVALPASATVAHPPQSAAGVRSDVFPNPYQEPDGGAYGPYTCQPGYVWRDSFDGDTLCTTPEVRDRVHAQNPHRQPGGGAYGPSTCKPGYVWREMFDGDVKCVTPQERERWKDQVFDNGPNLIPVPG
ncbi:hypothetical protein DEJ51_22550 [Streptomyces venezuelae]|uniref:Secreted protein n=1 Tax=Streptomyces venezuelae TaxID=54571 RepID=A0A5P2DN27_STRVZ|nr:hypothetical protein [Streptomyces venezuelae]QES56615.1 hypothetical protein DEJ51_22550 [Streptomyces venezuelae]